MTQAASKVAVEEVGDARDQQPYPDKPAASEQRGYPHGGDEKEPRAGQEVGDRPASVHAVSMLLPSRESQRLRHMSSSIRVALASVAGASLVAVVVAVAVVAAGRGQPVFITSPAASSTTTSIESGVF